MIYYDKNTTLTGVKSKKAQSGSGLKWEHPVYEDGIDYSAESDSESYKSD